MSDVDLSTISSADLSAALQAREYAVIQPLATAWQNLQSAASAAQAAMSGISDNRAKQLINNTLQTALAYLTEANAVAALSAPAAAAAASTSAGTTPPAS